MHNFQQDLSNKVKEDISKNTPQIPLSLKEIVNVNGNNNVIKNKKKFLNKNKSTLNSNKLEIKEIENNTINNLNTYINNKIVVNTSNNNFCNINNNSSNNNSNFDIPKKNNYTSSILSNAHFENTTTINIPSSPSVPSKRKYYEIKDKNSNTNSPTQTPVKIKLTHNSKILSQDKNSNYNSIIKDFTSPPITPTHSNIVNLSKEKNNYNINTNYNSKNKNNKDNKSNSTLIIISDTNNNNNNTKCRIGNKNNSSSSSSSSSTGSIKKIKNIENNNNDKIKKKMLWDDFNAGPSSSSSSSGGNNNNNNNINNSRNKGKHHSLTDEEIYIINTADDDSKPLEFYTETSTKLSSEDSNVIDLDNYSTPKNENNESDDDDVILISNVIDDKNSSLNSNNTNTNINSNINSNNDNNNHESDHQDDTLTEDELLAIRLQFEEQEEFNNRMASLSEYNLNDNFYDLDDLQIHSLYSSLDNFSSPMFMNSRGYVMDLRNYIEDDELDDSYEGLLRLEERIGNVKHSLDNDLINKNKVIKYSKDNKEIQETKCSICLLNYEKDEELRKLLCSHFFHKRCIDNWFKNSSTCPICRMDVKEKLKK